MEVQGETRNSAASQPYAKPRGRGVFGWLFLTFFWLWNLAMAAWMFASLFLVGQQEAQTDAARAGLALGGMMVVAMIGVLWLIGAAILYMLVRVSDRRR